jgi:hypothetical protein
LAVEENTVEVASLAEALANADQADVLRLKVGDVHLQMVGKGGNLGLVYPDVTGGSRATISTLSTLKAKSVLIPRLSGLTG